jgi:hypothetical protein
MDVDFMDVVDYSGFLPTKRPLSPIQDLLTWPDVRIIRQRSNDQRFTEAKALFTARAWLSTDGFRAVKTWLDLSPPESGTRLL